MSAISAVLLVALAAAGPASGGVLFACKTDKVFTDWSSNAKAPRHSRMIRGDLRLTLDVRTGALTLFVRRSGGADTAFPLKDVEQTNSPGSGTSFKADTTIRGRSRRTVLTLFAEYDNANTWHDPEAHGDAALEMENGRRHLLVLCGPNGFASRRVKAGSRGLTSIYGLEADGLARDLTDPPDWPDAQ